MKRAGLTGQIIDGHQIRRVCSPRCLKGIYDKTRYGIHGRRPCTEGVGAPARPAACAARCATTSCATAGCLAASCSDHACCCANLDRCCCAWAGNIKPAPARHHLHPGLCSRRRRPGRRHRRAPCGSRCNGPGQLRLQNDASGPGHRTRRPVELGGPPWRPPGRAELQPPLHLRKVRLRWPAPASAGRRRLVLCIAVTPGERLLLGPPTRAPTLPVRLQPEPGVGEDVVYPHQGWRPCRHGRARSGGAGRCLHQAPPDGCADAPELEGNE